MSGEQEKKQEFRAVEMINPEILALDAFDGNKRRLTTEDGIEYDPYRMTLYTDDVYKELAHLRKKASRGDAFTVASRIIERALAEQKTNPLRLISRVYESDIADEVASDALDHIIGARFHAIMEKKDGRFKYTIDFSEPPAPESDGEDEE